MGGIRNVATGGLLALLAGCATASHEAAAPSGTRSGFSGAWSVEWCDASNPHLDCGGFSVNLRQIGSRVCGEFGGALVNLRQVDEGDIAGTADGDTAMLEVRSGRNGAIVRIKATRVGGNLHWKEAGTVRPGEADISIIAFDDVLKPMPSESMGPLESCSE